jgi:hypothetical protein
MQFESLPSSAQSAYADLLDGLLDAPPPQRGLSYLRREIRKQRYWYLQQVIGGQKRSFYLVGTHAFVNLGNLLCVRWSRTTSRTEDIDVAHDPRFEVATPIGNLEAELKGRDPGFIAVPSLDPRHPSTSFRIRGKRLSVSLLTPERGKPATKPLQIPALKAAATPIRYLDYLIEGSLLAAVPAAAGILIRIPDPARFALHKLVLSQRRPTVMTAKTRKDIEQADALLAVLLDIRPGDISRAADAARHQGAKFYKLLTAANQLLSQTIQKRLQSLFS